MSGHALIGYSGFVGTTLEKQHAFTHRYRSTDIADIENRTFDLVVCAGAPAQKWIANREPEVDARRIDGLIDHLRTVKAGRFVLISTVDVFRDPSGVDEDSAVDEDGLHAYGFNRRRLERFVQEHFAEHLVVRLPGLVGPGLRKNVIYDFLNDNNIEAIDSRSVFQFYPMVNLWPDIEVAIAAGLRLVHLTAEPVSVAEIAGAGFGRRFENHRAATVPRYDFRTRHAALFGGSGGYQYARREVLLATRAYAQSEPAAEKKPA